MTDLSPFEGSDVTSNGDNKLIENGLNYLVADPEFQAAAQDGSLDYGMKSQSDGSTADYYQLPEGSTELQDLISYRNMNAQIGEIFRACFRYGHVAHSERLRDAKKIAFYAQEEVKRLEKYGDK